MEHTEDPSRRSGLACASPDYVQGETVLGQASNDITEQVRWDTRLPYKGGKVGRLLTWREPPQRPPDVQQDLLVVLALS